MGSPSEAEQSSTRYLETTRGTLSNLAVADIVAGNLVVLLDRIAEGEYSEWLISSELVREFHRQILEPIVPQMAGKWRAVDVSVGKHLPPRHFYVPVLMVDYGADLEAQVGNCGGDIDRQVEALAFAEGMMLSIHPFEDFNGRAVRAFLAELFNRLDIPPLETSVPRNTEDFERYKLALRGFDKQDPRLLRAFWVERFEAGLSTLELDSSSGLDIP